MAITVTPKGAFDGGNCIQEVNYALGETRKLVEIIRELQDQANTNETDIATNGALITGLGTPFDYKGDIAVRADFPTPAAVEDGWTYIITADVEDTLGTQTNTGQAFKEGDEIVWNGTDWTRLGRKVTELSYSDVQAVAATETTFAFMATAAGAINTVIAKSEATADAGEDMAIDVQIDGVTCLTSAIDIDAAAGTTVQVGTVDTTANTFSRGAVISIVRTYTAGAAPTPIVGTKVWIGYQETLSV